LSGGKAFDRCTGRKAMRLSPFQVMTLLPSDDIRRLKERSSVLRP
jgi:hypothetical protein